ncbi:phytanoyl-CoA dioxygenase family protein [Kiloniella litopenaei]|uniref:phytanoyl-CoA dioxygenase family protein n=1 Tax=Kiloniella litopenaei TaxID=1549748 RepID=UPI003BAA4ECD
MVDLNYFEELENNGAVTITDFLNYSDIQDIQNSILSIFNVENQQDLHLKVYQLSSENKSHLFLLYQMLGRNTSFLRIVSKIGDFCEKHFPSKSVLCLDTNILLGLPNDVRLAHDWHQEEPYYPGLNNPVFTFWFPIMEDSTIEIGTMSTLDGSHKEGLLPYYCKKKVNGFTELVPRDVDELTKKYNEDFCELLLGDVYLFHHNLIHRSNWNSTSRTRFSGCIRFCVVDQMPERLSGFDAFYA